MLTKTRNHNKEIWIRNKNTNFVRKLIEITKIQYKLSIYEKGIYNTSHPHSVD